MSKKGRRRIRIIAGLCGFVVVGLVLFNSCMVPRVKVSCTTDSEGRLVIEVRKNYGVDGLRISVLLEDEETPAWSVDLSGKSSWSITYGMEGEGVRENWRPPGGAIPAIPSGSEFRILASWTTSWSSVSGGSKYFTFGMLEDGVPIPF